MGSRAGRGRLEPRKVGMFFFHRAGGFCNGQRIDTVNQRHPPSEDTRDSRTAQTVEMLGVAAWPGGRGQESGADAPNGFSFAPNPAPMTHQTIAPSRGGACRRLSLFTAGCALFLAGLVLPAQAGAIRGTV